MMNFLSFCLSKNVCICSYFLRKVLTGIVFLVGSFLLFSTLNILSHSLVVCKISAEKFADVLKGSSFVHGKLVFFWGFQNFVFDFWQFDYNVPWCGFSGFIYLVFFGLLEFGHPFPSPHLESFQPLFLWLSFWSFLSLYAFWDSPNANNGLLDGIT